MTESLHDMVAIVTGASREIGAAMAEALADAGATVMLAHYGEHERASAAVARIEAAGGRALAYEADLSSVAANQQLIAHTVATFGRLDVFVANAGITTSCPFLETDEATWDALVNLNLKGSFFGAQAAAHQMVVQGDGGKIVFSSSVTGMQALPGMAAYGVTKAGLRHMTKTLALELGPFGIRVNALGIGATVNERNLHDDPNYAVHWSGVIPAGRAGRPYDVAAALMFLISPQATMITGHTLLLDGGWSMYSPVP